MRFVCESCGSPFATEDRSAARCPRCAGPLRTEPPGDQAAGPVAEPRQAVERVLDWYVAVDDEPVGPLGARAVRARWEAGQVGPESLCWRPGLSDWQPVAEVRELHEYLRAGGRAAAPPRAATPPRAEEPAAGARTPGLAAGAAGLAALAGAEFSGRASARQPSLLDLLTSPHSPAPNGAMQWNVAVRAPTAAEPPASAQASAPASPQPPAAPRLSAPGAFALGAVAAGILALALIGIVARERRPSADAPAAARAVPAAPERIPARPEPPQPEPAVARGEVAPSAPVRVSDPPASPQPTAAPVASGAAAPAVAGKPAAAPAATPEPAPKVAAGSHPRPAHPRPADARAAASARAPARGPARGVAKPARAARTAPPPPAGPRVAMAEPARPRAPAASREPELPPAPVAAPGTAPEAPRASAAKTVPRDPLLDAVTDDELERELAGGASKPAAKASPSAVYVPPAQPAQAAQAAPAPAPGGDLPEGVTAAQINEAVGARVGALRGCIEEQRAGDPGAKGTLRLRWTIAGDGGVRDLRNLSSEYEGQPIARCIGGVVKGIRFPASRTKGQEVVFPFKF